MDKSRRVLGGQILPPPHAEVRSDAPGAHFYLNSEKLAVGVGSISVKKKKMKSAAKIPSEFTCDRCSYSGRTKAALYAHRKIHAEKNLRCDFCDYKTQFSRNLTLHNRTHSGEKPFICEFSNCNYSSSQAPNLAQHVLLIHSNGKPFPCKTCSESFKSKHHLNTHVIAKHKGKRPHQCLHHGCEYSSTKITNVKKHMFTHTGERPFQCYFNECDYAGTERHHLTVHIRTHTGERPNRCIFKDCEYSSARFVDMERHALTHSGQKPHRCNFEDCGFSSARESSLKNHLLRHLDRTEPSTRPVESRASKSVSISKHLCKICEFKTRKLKKYNAHVQSHREQGHLLCFICDFVTLKQKRFEKHMTTHETTTECEFNSSERKNVTPDAVQSQNSSCNNNSLLTKDSPKVVKKPGTVGTVGMQLIEIAAKQDVPNHKKLKRKHHFNFNSHPQIQHASKKRAQIEPGLESLSSNTYLNHNLSTKNSLSNLVGVKIEKESSVEPSKCTLPTNAPPNLENIDCTHSALPVKVEQCKKYSCPVCDFGTKKKRKYKDHVEFHQKEGDPFFPLPNKSYDNDSDNSAIQKSSCSKKPLMSQGILSDTSLFLNSHSLPRPGNQEAVDESFSPVQLSEGHIKLPKMKESETSVEQKRFGCSVCDYKTQYKQSLTDHVRIHTGDRPFSCTYSECNYSSAIKCNLLRHLVLIHSDNKPFCCPLCGERFRNRQFLNSHIRNHKGKRPICCQYKGCEFSCTFSWALKRHIRTHTLEKPYHCYFKGCGFSCSREDALKLHIRIHTGERPYHCTFKNCNFSAIHSSSLKPHLLSHTKDKPYHCNFNDCKFSSAQSGHLKLHMMRHATQSPHACPKCKLRFRTPLEIEQHLETHHKLQDASNNGHLLPNVLKHQAKSHLEFRPVSSSIAQTQPSLLLEPPATESDLNTSRNRKTSLPKPGIQKKEESTARVEGIEGISPTKTQPSGVNNGLPQCVSQEKAKPLEKYSCPICEFGTKKKRKYKDHVELHQREGHLFCSLCDFVSLSGKLFKKHLRAHRNNLRANIPNVQLANEDIPLNLDVPPVSSNSLSVTRSDCNEIAVDDSAAEQLSEFDGDSAKRKVKENLNVKKTLCCSVCDFKTQYKGCLTRHVRIHIGGRTFSCTYSGCNHSSRRKDGLIRHLLRRHSDEKPYCCQLCGKRFRNRLFLNSHVRNHKGKRPICCQYKDCEFSCTKSSDLKRHILTHTGEKPYHCDFEDCGFSCNRDSVLKRHIGTHSGYKPYLCTFTGCSHSTRDAGNLKTHILTHTGAKPFHCDFNDCKFSAAQSSNLKIHMLRHFTQNPHECPKCKFRSHTLLEIGQHLEAYHKLQNTASKGGHSESTVALAIRENPAAEDISNVLHVQTQPSLSSQNNIERNPGTRDEVGPSKKYLCARCDFESKSKKKYKSHLDSHQQKNKNTITEVSVTSSDVIWNENSSQTQQTVQITKKSAKVAESPNGATDIDLRMQKKMKKEDYFNNHVEFSQVSTVSSSSTQTLPSLQLQPPAIKSSSNPSRSRKTNSAKVGMEREETSSAAVEVIEGISRAQASFCVVSNDIPQSVSQVKAKPWKKYLCPICEFGTKKKRQYKDHVELHQKEGYLFCSLCDFFSVNSKRLKKHLLTHENDSYDDDNNSETQKSSCSKVLLRSYDTLSENSSFVLNSHSLQLGDEVAFNGSASAVQLPENGVKLLMPMIQENDIKSSDGEKMHYCSICDYKTKYTSDLTRHNRVHTGERSYSCTYIGCTYSSARKHVLDRHILLRHSNEKPFSCKLCGEEFQNKRLLNSHVPNHRGKRPYCCLYKSCEFSSTFSWALKRHIRTHTLEKPYHCYFKGCGFSCSREDALKLHIRIHTGERPYHCTFKNCSFSGRTSGSLTTHLLSHTKVKPFHCDFNGCKFSTSQGVDLKVHMLRHLVQNPHVCPKCTFRSRTPLEIEQHLATHHTLQNTSPSSGQFQPPIRESLAESVTNILRVQTVLSFSSQNSNDRFSTILEDARSSKNYICARCGFNSKSKKKYKGHLESHVEKIQLLETRDTKLSKHKTSSKEGSDISSTRNQTKNSTVVLRESKKSLAPFSCNFCKKSFAKEMKLLNHLRYHTGQTIPGI